jgi:TRAP-type C4-dicarboxylate transport system permease small subunit
MASMMFLFAILAWAGGVIVSFYNGNMKFPITVLVLGLILLIAPVGAMGLAGIAILAVIIWIANKLDM